MLYDKNPYAQARSLCRCLAEDDDFTEHAAVCSLKVSHCQNPDEVIRLKVDTCRSAPTSIVVSFSAGALRRQYQRSSPIFQQTRKREPIAPYWARRRFHRIHTMVSCSVLNL